MSAEPSAESNRNVSCRTIDWPITAFSVSAVFIFVAFMAIVPDATLKYVTLVFEYTTLFFGVPILWFVFLGLMLCFYLAFGKYGSIRFGDSEPEYSFFSYLSMMICAALATAALVYSFIEWSFYYTVPPFGLEAKSVEAAEYALPYAFFHWGLSVQVVFVLTTIAMAYAVYVRKVPVFRVSAICEAMMGDFKHRKFLGKVIDVISIFSIVGGKSVTIGLGVPLIAAGVGRIFGFTPSFTTSVCVVVFLAMLFSFSSFVGIDKGMKKFSSFNIYIAVAFVTYIFIVGPTEFIVKEFTNSIGVMISNYCRMSLWTDPIGKSGFPESNTIFLFTLALNYAALMGVFITKISKGRTIREAVLTCLIALSFGTWVLFGINSGFAMHAELTGAYKLTEAASGQAGIFALLDLLPGGILIPIIFTITATGFLGASLDSAAFSLSAVATAKLDDKGNTNPVFRLFWCVVLTLVPLTIMFTGAPFSALKTLCIFLSVPFLFVIIYMNIGLFRWLREDVDRKGK